MKKYYLAIDLGGTSGRGTMGAFDGRVLDLGEIRRFPNYFVNIAGEDVWDIAYLLREASETIEKCRETAEGRLISVGIDSWGTDYGLLDRHGRLIGQVRCTRNMDDEAEKSARKKLGAHGLFFRTGMHSLKGNTLYQLLQRKTESDPALEAADKLLMLPDLMAYFLTGEMWWEYTAAATSMMLNPYTKTFDRELMSLLGLDASLTGEISMPGSVGAALKGTFGDGAALRRTQVDAVGTSFLGKPAVAGGAAALHGTDAGGVAVFHGTNAGGADFRNVNVNAGGRAAGGAHGHGIRCICVAGHDTASAIAAAPLEKGDAFLSSGTWSVIGLELGKDPLINDEVMSVNIANEGLADGRVRLTKNLMGMWAMEQLLSESPAGNGVQGRDRLIAEASAEEAGRFIIDLEEAEFSQSGHMYGKINDYCLRTGQRGPENHAQALRAIFESMALSYRMALNELEHLTGRRTGALCIVGGGSRNEMLNQFVADCLDRPVYTGPAEAASAGNILIQCMTDGELGGFDEIRSVVRESFTRKIYLPKAHERWNEAYGLYENLTKARRMRDRYNYE